MNRTLATLILTVSATLGVTSLQAQDKAVATVPFAFHVRSTTMPAGKYVVGNFSSGARNLLSIAGYDGHSLFVGTQDRGKSNPDDPKLTFSCYKGDCTLEKIDLPGSSVSHSIVPSNSTHSLGMASMISIRVTH